MLNVLGGARIPYSCRDSIRLDCLAIFPVDATILFCLSSCVWATTHRSSISALTHSVSFFVMPSLANGSPSPQHMSTVPSTLYGMDSSMDHAVVSIPCVCTVCVPLLFASVSILLQCWYKIMPRIGRPNNRIECGKAY